MYFYHNLKIKVGGGTSLVVQWPRPCIPNTGDPGSIAGWGTRSHMSQLTVCMPHLKILPVAKEIQHSEINSIKKKKKSLLLLDPWKPRRTDLDRSIFDIKAGMLV